MHTIHIHIQYKKNYTQKKLYTKIIQETKIIISGIIKHIINNFDKINQLIYSTSITTIASITTCNCVI